MALIEIEGMEFFAYHGCFAEEQVIGTRFNVDLVLETDTCRAEESDNLHDTINYMTVYHVIKMEMETKSHLLEHVAHRILKSCIQKFHGIQYAEVKISKLNPPLGGKIDRVSVTLSTDDWASHGH